MEPINLARQLDQQEFNCETSKKGFLTGLPLVLHYKSAFASCP